MPVTVVSTLLGVALILGACGSEPPARPVKAEVGFAMGAGTGSLDDDALAQTLDGVAASGASWIRIDFDWSGIEPQPGLFVWEPTDRVVEAAHARGIEILGIVTYTPPWARPDGSSDKHPPLSNDDWAAFVAAVGDRYASDVTHWEIWNEPNHAPFWEGGIDAARYAQLVNIASPLLRSAGPGSFIISGGLSPATDDSPSTSPETFIDQFLPLVDAGAIDAVGVHPYSYPVLPASDTPGWNTFGRLPKMKDLIDSHQSGLSLWLTEFGAPTSEVSADRQAASIAEAISCATRWEWAGPLFVYTWTDRDDEFFGVVEADGDPKVAAEEVRRLTGGDTSAADCPLN